MSASEAPAIVLCDSSFVGHQERAIVAPDTVAHWPADVVAMLNNTMLAISVIALAEIRAGRIYAGWGTKRCERQEARLAAFLRVPLDDAVMDQYAALHAWSKKGHPTPHNDLWIAATAMSRDLPLVSCDKHFEGIARDHALRHIYLAPRL